MNFQNPILLLKKKNPNVLGIKENIVKYLAHTYTYLSIYVYGT